MSIIRDCLDALLHPSARYDALTRARHRAFMAPRLLGSLVALAAFPVYLAMRGAPTAIEVAAFAWLIAPILLSWFLSRTGRYEGAHVLSSLAMAGLVMMVAVNTGGIESFAAIWLVVVPLEAALSASRRVVAFASALALSCAALADRARIFSPAAGVGAERGATRFPDGARAWFRRCSMRAGLRSAPSCWRARHVSLLNVEEDRYRLLARNMSDVISRHGRNGTVQFISPAAEALLGTPSRGSPATACSIASMSPTVRPISRRCRKPRAAEKRAASSSAFAATWSVATIFPPISSGSRCAAGRSTRRAPEAEVVAVMRDVTDRKMQQQALELARTAAEQADASKTRFLATMSHELRTPLNAIIGFSEMIVQEDVLMVDAAKRKEYAQLINDSGQHLLSVVNGILDMSKMETGNFEISPEPFAPRAALLHCCNLLALKARENGIDLITRASDDLPVMNGDPRAFKQIVLNLVANAIKFTERGGSVTVSAAVEGSRLMLRVADTGVGIAADDLKRIGDPFFQAGKTYRAPARRHRPRPVDREGPGRHCTTARSACRASSARAPR